MSNSDAKFVCQISLNILHAECQYSERPIITFTPNKWTLNLSRYNGRCASIKLSEKLRNVDRENTCVSKRQTLPPDPYVYTPSVDKILRKGCFEV